MYNGKFADRRRKKRGSKRAGAVMLSLLLLTTLTVSGTLAYLAMSTDPVKNTFTPSLVENEVKEDFTPFSSVKKNVKVKNTGDVDAFIRADVMVYWATQKTDENGEIYYAPYGGELPTEDVDYKMTWAQNSHWVLGKDGYFYYTQSVAPGGSTDVLLDQCVQTTEKDGYHLVVEVVSQSIQAKGTDGEGNAPVILAWGTEAGGIVESVSGAILTIQK